MSWVHLARALARPRGVARLVPARLRGALLRGTIERLLEERGLDELLEVLTGTGKAATGSSASASPTSTSTSTSSPTSTAKPSTTTSTSRTKSKSKTRTTSANGGGEHAAHATVAGLRRLPATCLHRALAGYASLREAGEEACFVIGVRRDGSEVVAHAWIEQGGAPVGEPEDPRARFTVAYVHPAPAPAQRGEPETMTTHRPSPDVILTTLADGTGVLLHLGTKFYFALNASGVVVWEALAAGQAADPDALAGLLVARFSGVEHAAARADVEDLLRELAAEGLLAKEG